MLAISAPTLRGDLNKGLGMSELTSPWPADRRITVRDLQEATVRGDRWTLLTSYDALTAGIFERAGVRVLLVGDTSAQTVFGYPSTLPATMDMMIPLVQAVVRGTKTALVVADLPFGAYQSGVQQAMHNAVRYLKEGGAQAVKLEGGRRVLPQVAAMTAAGIPVMGHLGLTPQSINALGSYRARGRGGEADVLLDDAVALERAGAFAIVLEAVPASLGARISAALAIPTIGVGGGPWCDAQGMVWQDLAGLTTGRAPRFVRRYAQLAEVLAEAAGSFVSDVADARYPGTEHSYA
jgi:3-methyl-2-oxobutanoate hydroxymethyltransferase